MNLTILWNTRNWAEIIAALPAVGPLSCRTVLVPRERVAHTLRRELILTGKSGALAGTRFLSLPSAAAEVLSGAGAPFEAGEEALRGARILSLFHSDLRLGHFPLDLLRDKPGWDEAFARTISDLEGADLRPNDIESCSPSLRLRDVAVIWRALDESAGHSWTTQRIILEAAAALEHDPRLWPFTGSVLAFAVGDTTVAEARFIRSLPDATLALLAARPARERYLQRMEALFGKEAGRALRGASAPRVGKSEKDVLASFLFEPPQVLAEAGRSHSDGPDGTVDIEEHAGVEEELEATADWVARQVGARTPLEEIAVLMPRSDPLTSLVTERLGRLPWQDGSFPVHVAGGLPLTNFAAGARALSVVAALREHLGGESLARVLPTLRSEAPEGRHLSHGAATELVWSLGIVGGNPANPEGALEWVARAKEREAELEAALVRARAEEEADGASGVHETRDIERLITDLQAIRPALEALVEVARHAISGAALSVIWSLLRDFFETSLLQPGEGPRVGALLDEHVGALAADSVCGSIAGDEALRLIEQTVTSARVPIGRFGEPAVYIGTVREAVGLRFRAVRIIGLSEGHLPAVSREDPVVPDALRRSLKAGRASTAPPPTAVDRALEDLHALDALVRNADERVAFSFARLDVERSQREPSSVILEVAAALARPNRATGKRGATIPAAADLRRDAFAPAREAAAECRLERPVGESAWQDGVSLRMLGIPPRWKSAPSLDLVRIDLIRAPDTPGPADGLLGAAGMDLSVPGLVVERPISPSALGTLLACPHAFLLGNILGFDEPASAPPQKEIGQPYYGNLFHRVAADFFESHGAAFCARRESLRHWLDCAEPIVGRSFDEFLRQYPLIGEAVRKQERERLRSDLYELLRDDWENGSKRRRFVAAERTFGRPAPVELPLGKSALFVRGRIDRIDVDGRSVFVWDYKTGRAHPRIGKEQDPDPGLDLQIAVYGLVANLLAKRWKIPERVAAAYAYVGPGGRADRTYRDFHEVLEPAALGWLAIARNLLAARMFPRTPNEDNCAFCSFRPVCGGGVYERAADLMVKADGVLAEFAALKGLSANDAEES